MDHLILLVLCWIFAAVAVLGEATKGVIEWHKYFVFDILFTAIIFGTPVWLALKGVYYLAITYIF